MTDKELIERITKVNMNLVEKGYDEEQIIEFWNDAIQAVKRQDKKLNKYIVLLQKFIETRFYFYLLSALMIMNVTAFLINANYPAVLAWLCAFFIHISSSKTKKNQ